MKIKMLSDCIELAASCGLSLTWDDIVGWDEVRRELWVSRLEKGERRTFHFPAQVFWETCCGGDGFAEFVEGDGFFPDLVVFECYADYLFWLNQK